MPEIIFSEFSPRALAYTLNLLSLTAVRLAETAGLADALPVLFSWKKNDGYWINFANVCGIDSALGVKIEKHLG